MAETEKRPWALILGASSGFGAATAIELAKTGFDIFGVHFDRRETLPLAEEVKAKVEAAGAKAVFFNANAGDKNVRNECLDAMDKQIGHPRDESPVRVMLHSLAFGTLKEFFSEHHGGAMSERAMNMTLHVMGHTLVYWTQDLVARKLMGRGGRVFAMTSSGSHRAWPSYGAISAAKAALEAHIRQVALECAKYGITANAIQAGVTDTPALRKIPGHHLMIEYAQRVNPHRRLTVPQDVARFIALMADERSAWVTGNVIACDGGEDVVG